MNDLTKRLNEVFEYYNMRKYSEFAEKTGLSHQVSSNYLKGKQKPDAEKLAIIIQSFDKIDAKWLLTGRGEMIKKSTFNEKEERTLLEITEDYRKIHTDDLVRYILYNQDILMQNPIFKTFIDKMGYKIAIDILEGRLNSK